MSGRNWTKNRQRQLVRDRGVEAAGAREISEADIERAVLGDTRGLPRTPTPAKKLPQGLRAIETAAKWLVANRQRLRDEGRNPVPELQREFGLSRKEACAAISRANEAESPR
ncbi:hypothetical protein [Aminobacter sp. Piv2-1]|uniref:hypothetical protein n=1 Tax=Aminobacter sp. Piv2-1 TaxID=3031122 RepID=UPI00309C2E87